MGRDYFHNDDGFKPTVQVKLDGEIIGRSFRNKGEALEYLRRHEELSKEEINRRVRFIYNN